MRKTLKLSLALAATYTLFTVHTIAQTTWNGSVDGDWANTANWSAGVPDASDDVTIPGSMPHQPNIGTAGALAKSVHVQSGATLSISASGDLSIDGFASYTVPFSFSAGLNNEGTVSNSGGLTLGAVSSVGMHGIHNQGSFNNNAGGDIRIDRSTSHGIYQNGTFTNTADITIGGVASVGSVAVLNLSTFTNSTCSSLLDIVADAVVSNSGSFTNAGLLVDNASGTSSISSNSGIVQNLNGGTFSIGSNTGLLATNTDQMNACCFILGPTTVCSGAQITLNSICSAGGTWSSNNTGVATVGVSSGIVTGVSGGTATISYTQGGNTASVVVTVNAAPSAAISIAESTAQFNVSTTDGILCPYFLLPPPSATLTASGGGTYLWSNGSTAAAITVGTAGTYSVVVTSAAGCQSTVSKTIAVNAIPNPGTITATPNIPTSNGKGVCFGSTITLSSSTPGGTWSALNKAPSPQIVSIDAMSGVVTPLLVTPAVDSHSVFYRVTQNGCFASAQVTTVVLDAPNAGSITGNASICSSPYYGNNTTQLSIVNGASGGTWSSSNTGVATVNGSGLVTAVYPNSGTTTISYTVTSGSCSSTATKVITVNENPSALVTSTPYNACVNTDVIVSVPDAGAGANYVWGGDIPNQNSNTIIYNTNIPGLKIYNVTVTSGAGCANSGFGFHIVNEPINTTITATPNPVCLGLSLTLSIPTAASTTVSWAGPGINNINAFSTTATPTAAGLQTYTVTVTANDYYGNCTYTGNVDVMVETTQPSCNVSGPTAVCPSSSTTFTAPPGLGGYSWSVTGNGSISGASNGSSVVIIAGSSGTYTVQLSTTSASGCTNTCNQPVTVGAVPSCPVTYVPPNGQLGVSTAAASLSWSAVPNITHYLVYFGTNAPNYDNIFNGFNNGTATSKSYTELTPNTTYGYRIVPVNDCGQAVGCITNTFSTCVPTYTCPSNRNVNLNANCSVTIPDLITGLAADPGCGTLSFTQNPAANTVVAAAHNAAILVTITPDNPAAYVCQVTLTAKDVTPPSISCPANATVNANASCQGAIGSYSAASLSDNCNLSPTVTQSPVAATLLTGHNSTQTVTLTANDGNGNTASCTLTVTLKDVTPPSISCPANATVNANASCQGAIGSYSAATLSDNCNPSPTVTQSPGSATLLSGHNSTQTVTLTANDGNGNTASCTLTVTLKDVTPPSISCPANATVNANASCQGAIGSYSAATLSDNCNPSPTVTQSPGSATLLSGHNSTQTVTLTANDGNGNTASCTLTVTLKDVTPPSISCPANATVNANASCQGAIGTYSAASLSDNCNPSPTVTQSPGGATLLSGHNSTQTVTLTANDGNGNTATCTLTVTLKDVTPPSISCPANATVNANASCQGAIGTYAAATLSDNCNPSPTVTQSPSAATLLSGHNSTQTVTLTANDGNGNTATCTLTVTLKDVTPPSISCPANATVNANASCQGAIGTYSAATLSDNCNPSPTVTQSPSAATLLSGHNSTQTVTLTANDGNGNTASCTLTVTLKDVTPPSISCPANATVNANASCQGAIGSYSAASLSDNCNPSPTVTQSPGSATLLSGHNSTQTVTLTANDGNGNTASCTLTVTLKDVTPPSLVCRPKVEVTLGASGTGVLAPASMVASASDNCGTVNLVSAVPNTFTCSNIGNSTAVLTANDGNGNTATCSSVVSVVDLIAPTMLCKPATVNLDAAGQAGITASTINNGSYDNCGISGMTLSQSVFNCAHVGANLVTLTGTDLSGNTGQCTAIVTVRDLLAPMAKCKPATANIGASGTLVLNPALINNGSTDNCSFTLSTLPSVFNCSQLGANTVTLIATDGSGNTGTCTAVVTIRDATPPTALCKSATIFLDEDGMATLNALQVDNGSFDNCGVTTKTVSQTSFNCSDLAGSPRTVVLRLTDNSGNTATCYAQVTVKDVLAPDAVCSNVTVALSASGIATVFGASLANQSTDNCSVWSYSPIAKTYTAANLGPNNLTITVKDWSGNPSTCVSVVTVVQNGQGQGQSQGRQNNDGELILENGFVMYPNPTSDLVHVAFETEVEEMYELRIFDIKGQLVVFHQLFASPGEYNDTIDVSPFDAGVYIVELSTGNTRMHKRLVIARL